MAKHDIPPTTGAAQTTSAAGRRVQAPVHAAHEEVHAEQRVVTGPEGRMIGPFALPDAAGRQVRFRDYRERRNLVIMFHHGVQCAACRHLLQALAAQVAVLHEQQAVVLTIGPDSDDRALKFAAALGQAMLLLIDPVGRTVARAGLRVPALVVADRWGEIWAAWEGGAEHALPPVTELEAWLNIIQCDCT